MAVVITGSNTPTAGGITYGDGTTYATTAAGSSGQPVVSGGAGAPAFRPYTLPASDGSASQVLQTNGSGALSFATPSSGLSAATQAQMEAASVNTVAATPSNTQYHPGVAKAWVRTSGGATPAITASHNMTSITDDGVGLQTFTIATDFSSSEYVVVASILDNNLEVTTVSAIAAGSFQLKCYLSNSGSFIDPNTGYAATCFGDQA